MEAIIIFVVFFWIVGIIIDFLCWRRLRDYKCYSHPYIDLCVCIFLCCTMSWALVILSIINNEFETPNWLYHDCHKHYSIYFEDFDYDKDGNIMSEYDIDNFGHRETYRVYKCNICGKEKRERLQWESIGFYMCCFGYLWWRYKSFGLFLVFFMNMDSLNG